MLAAGLQPQIPVLSDNLRKGLYGTAIVTEPLLETLIALLPCLLTVAKLFQTRHPSTQLQERNPELSRKPAVGTS